MILVTLGTQDKSFKRLLVVIDKEIEKGNIKDKVVVQAGFTKYKSKNMEIFKTLPSDELEQLIIKADLIITHGGVGSILTALKHNKKVIAAPRLAKYGEHTNDHQKEIIDEFSKRGYILALKDFNKFDKVLAKSVNFKPKKYESNNKNFTNLIANYIDTTNHISWFNRDKLVILTSIINLIIFTFLCNLSINMYLSFTISYFISIILLTFFKARKLPNPLTVICCFYLIEGFSLILLVDNLSLNYFLAKLIINIVVIFIYHLLNKKN